METTEKVRNLSSPNDAQTLDPQDIKSIATILEKIVAVGQEGNEVRCMIKSITLKLFPLASPSTLK